MDSKTRCQVRERAGNRCEYCGLPQEATPLVSHHIEHILAKQHGGDDSIENLALACDRCNAYKGPNLTTVAPETGEIVSLFNPRNHVWAEHFEQLSGEIIGRTEIGRATVRLLNMKAPRRAELRKLFWTPPSS